MKNEPEKWEHQVWTVPKNTLRLVRKGKDWCFQIEGTFENFYTLQAGDISRAEILSGYIEDHHVEEDWIDRHSLQFRWLRFWYRRKKRREARKLLSLPSTVKE